MKTLMGLFFGALLLAVIAAPFALVYSTVEKSPLVITTGAINYTDIDRAKKILQENDPRTMKDGEERLLSIEERDLNVLVRYGMSRLGAGGATVALTPNNMIVRATFPLPQNPLGSYINSRLHLVQVGRHIVVKRLDIGKITVPSRPANWLIQTLHKKLSAADADYRNLFQALKSYQVTDDYLLLVYQWQSHLAKRIMKRGKKVVVSSPDRQRQVHYYRELVQITRAPDLEVKVGLDRLLSAMLAAAKRQSDNGADPVAENRAALLVLALYVSGINPARVLGDSIKGMPKPARHDVLLRNRKDLPKHFMISVALKVAGGSSLANALGIFKEIDDSRGGSGFSFVDLTADRAGVRFAVVAVGSPAMAARIQSFSAQGMREDDFMPAINGLPEFMQEKEFQRAYGGVDGPRYRVLADEIERRIDKSYLYSSL